ncbi:protein SAR DEFICIENT 1-like isoform X2 [Tripterygium wilfordii]|nr:protein SAR DEFICIENT 1-like isoform X2 [Tripterygium wilfordii]
MENTLKRCSISNLTRQPSFRIQALEPSTLQLVFPKTLSLPIFTGSKVVHTDNCPLQILLVDKSSTGGHNQMLPSTLPYPIKIEIVVLDGDFPSGDGQIWTSQDFDNNVLKERTGKRPLLAGDSLIVSMRDGVAVAGEFEFTDNSSWIRSRKFRIGARVFASGSCNSHGVRIREAMTEAFVVKDHRGELYKKHHPPSLEDEVWRLEKIGKDGAFHKKLASEGIKTVQDLLKLSTANPLKLRKILGGMSDKIWNVTMKHARTCVMGNKHYIYKGNNFTITFNPICQVVKAMIDGRMYFTSDLTNIDRTYVQTMVSEAYTKWHTLEENQEVEGLINETALLTHGDMGNQYLNYHQQEMMISYQQNGFEQASSSYFGAPVEQGLQYCISESSSDGEYMPSKSFINSG